MVNENELVLTRSSEEALSLSQYSSKVVAQENDAHEHILLLLHKILLLLAISKFKSFKPKFILC